MDTQTAIPDTLPTDEELAGEQQYLFEDELLVLVNQLAEISIKQSQLADKKKTCKSAIIKEMKKLNIDRGAAELSDGEKLEIFLEEVLKIKKVVAK